MFDYRDKKSRDDFFCVSGRDNESEMLSGDVYRFFHSLFSDVGLYFLYSIE